MLHCMYTVMYKSAEFNIETKKVHMYIQLYSLFYWEWHVLTRSLTLSPL